MANKIDSNVVGLAIAEEVVGSPRTLPGTPVWQAFEPNSYADFGAQITTVARDTINASRQNQKGTTTDVDASGGFQVDVTQNNLTKLLQGFFFADLQEKADTAPLNGTAGVTLTNVTTTTYAAASGLGAFKAGHIVLGSGFTNSGNNALKVLSNASGTTLTTTGLTAETPPAGSRVQAVGFQFGSGDLTLTVSGGVLTVGATTQDLTQLGLEVGEWIWIGGDASGVKPATSPSGFARIKSIAATAIVCDKVSAAFVTDNCSGKTIQIFFGKFLRNRAGASIKTRTYQLERQLGNDGDGVQSEYLEGAIANQLTLNVATASKLTADLSFIALDKVDRDGATGVKSGTRVAAPIEDAFNTSTKVYRTKMSILDPATLVPTPLFAYLTGGSISINNNASLIKAVGVIGGVDTSLGNFVVSGNTDALFTTLEGAQAVRDNADVTLDMIFAQDNAGMIFDIPLLSLGNGRLNVQKDQPVTLPLEMNAAANVAGYTLGYVNFPYLPTAAMPS